MGYFDQFTPEQMKAGYARNIPGLERMFAKAEATGLKVNGYTREQLAEMVRRYKIMAITGKPIAEGILPIGQPFRKTLRIRQRLRLQRSIRDSGL